MHTLDYVTLAVADPARSAKFYTALLEQEPVQNSETFVLYVFGNGMKLGLWIDKDMQPSPLPPGGVEVTFSLPDKSDVDACFTRWKAVAEVLQEPTVLGFGYSFAVADPDGHRLRIFTPATAPR